MVNSAASHCDRRYHIQHHCIFVTSEFIAYRRYMKRKISFEMQSRVDDMVSKYIEFYSERSGKKWYIESHKYHLFTLINSV